jgi:hypothetical protein
MPENVLSGDFWCTMEDQNTDQEFGHTGRELELMLSGAKPLSMFYDDPDEIIHPPLIPEFEFDPYVEKGLFKKASRIFDLAINPKTGKPYRIRYVLYALAGEEWRMPALLLTKEISLKVKMPNEAIDRIVSTLLGYSEQEIEAHFSFGRS